MVSLREQLNEIYPTQPDVVKALLNTYWDEVQDKTKHWCIGCFISMVKAAKHAATTAAS
jgi:hypothetical protein